MNASLYHRRAIDQAAVVGAVIASGKSVGQIARETGTTTTRISGYTDGRVRSTDTSFMDRLAAALGVRPADLTKKASV